MRTYVLDEIGKEDMARAVEWVAKRADLSGVEGLYWVNFQPDLLTPVQFAHKECQPHCFAIEVTDDAIKFELLVRSRVNYRCRTCQVYASEQQRQFIIEMADRLVQETGILT